jgi:transcriptional regulator with XRE-family HTH domain
MVALYCLVCSNASMDVSVKQLRLRLKESQQGFAGRLGVSIRAVANYEGGRTPTLAVLFMLANIASREGYQDLADEFSSEYASRLKGSSMPVNDDETAWVRMILALLRNREAVQTWTTIERDVLGAMEDLAAIARSNNNLKTDVADLETALAWAKHRLAPEPDVKLRRMAIERSKSTGETFFVAFKNTITENPELYESSLVKLGLTAEQDSMSRFEIPKKPTLSRKRGRKP